VAEKSSPGGAGCSASRLLAAFAEPFSPAFLRLALGVAIATGVALLVDGGAVL